MSSCCGSMSSVNPNPSVGQGCNSCSAQDYMNTIGKWGTVLTGIITNKPVTTGPGGSVAIGATGTGLPGTVSTSGMLIVAVIIVAVILLVK